MTDRTMTDRTMADRLSETTMTLDGTSVISVST